ncbi:MAG: alanine racemase [Proteobacteria bacterium]|jgi:alanine racemase|nr:alanine racemase [Pseudomonadota bacterium]
MARPTKAIINLAALRHNFDVAQSLAPESKLIPVIKANAYGHGAVPCAKALSRQAPAFAVACIEEADELRKAGITQTILLLEGVFEAKELSVAASQNYSIVVENQQQLTMLLDAELPSALIAWLKVDSGMHRLGFSPEQASAAWHALEESPNVVDELVLMSHFSSAEDLDSPATGQQVKLVKALASEIGCKTMSLANSAGLIAWPESRCAWNRPGYMIYGRNPLARNSLELKPVMQFVSKVCSIRTINAGDSVGYNGAWTAKRESTIATIPVGYGDGYPRTVKGGTPVLVNGERAPLVGTVSMDMILVDTTDIVDVEMGAEVELWGEHITVDELGEYSNSSGYEVLTRMPARVLREYQG